IAGSDSSAGAGIQADLKTAQAFGCYAQTAITAVTAQNTLGVRAVHLVPPEIVAAQIEACVSDIGADAIKIGMLGSGKVVKAVAAALRKHARKIPIVLDPVMVSTSGHSLLAANAVAAMTKDLFPLATLVTPNIPEAKALAHLKSARRNDAEAAARKLIAMGAGAALIKGGHATRATIDDVMVWKGGVEVYAFPRIKTRHTHGTGCTLSTAIACGLAQGQSLSLAVGKAREYVQHAIGTAPGLGRGLGPLNHAV
ncbi:MAG TPA: bifunctional hydroxymethylpyrimidine kinase/phosphomethylpyrimidine kinase, partial [Rhizomicrobium sp.]|nr:bifunctional hydroxymethylpyrimidine kinase/phosphomethylpyrimidine kinase [Rhizomicrobium sp.]